MRFGYGSYLYTLAGSCRVRKTDTDDTICLLVVENYVSDIANFGALISDVFLDIENGSDILLLIVRINENHRLRDHH